MDLRLIIEKKGIAMLSKMLTLLQRRFMQSAAYMSKRLDEEEKDHVRFISECEDRITSIQNVQDKTILEWDERKKDLDNKKATLIEMGKMLGAE